MADQHDMYGKIGFVLASKYRGLVLRSLVNETKTSREISEDNNISIRAIMKATKELKDLGLIEKDNNRKYAITTEGVEIYIFLKKCGLV